MNAFFCNLVHQINTPITNFIIYGDFLMQEELQEEESVKFAFRMRQQVQLLLHGFLYVSYPAAGQMCRQHPIP